MNQYVMGIDVGTGSVRVGVFDLYGNTIGMAVDSYPSNSPKNGWVEQLPSDWWAAVCRASQKVMNENCIRREDVKGLSVDATCCTVLAVDASYRPLRPAIMWMDVRATEQAKRISTMQDEALCYCGYGNLSAEWMPCKALWLKENEPDIYNESAHIIECVDWISYNLTNRKTLSLNNVSVRWFYNNRASGWPEDFYKKIGLGDLLSKFPEEVLPMGATIGPLTEEAAGNLGLCAGIPVAEGGADAHCGVVGLNVVHPGRMALITGTSSLHLGLTPVEMHKKGLLGSFPDAIVSGLHLVECGQITTGAIVNWIKEIFFTQNSRTDKPDSQTVYKYLNDLAANIPIGSDGLILTDYFQGNRTPYTDADVRGNLYGLSLIHRAEHIYRAALEGIAYGTEQILREYDSLGQRPTEMYICGGATKSRLWMQIHADVSNVTIHVPNQTEAPCLGAAILASVGAGLYSSIEEAAEAMVSFAYSIKPNAENHEKYQFYVDRYIELYELLKDWMHSVTKHAIC